jgi:pyruvate,water dikinase
MRSSEITAALREGKPVPPEFRKILAKRFEDHAIVLEDGKVSLYWGDELETYRSLQEKDTQIHGNVTELSGLGSSPGNAIGKAVVVRTSKDLHRVLKGDVLVTTMTTPEFVPALERACAIVTDEGGILCHASIVSRELHRPCVVGTRIATKVISDGDEIQVNATAGKVKIIKKV